MTDDPLTLIEVPYDQLSSEALRGVIESFVLREGTEYGAGDVPLAKKVAQVQGQLERGEAVIIFQPEDESLDIRPRGFKSGRKG